jgi:peptide/nickel transport system permease protein
MVLLAVYAPLIASNQPLLWVVDGQVTFPLLTGLFNRLLYENSVDILFNLLLVLSPAYAALAWGLRRHLGARRFRLARVRIVGAIGGGHLLVVMLMAPESIAGAENPLHYKAPAVNYATLIAEREAANLQTTAIFPVLRFSYRDTDPGRSVAAPSATHWLGTDAEGRDVFTRMLYGTRISLTIGVVAVGIYVAIGVVLGATAGYFGGWADMLISRLIEVMICFPSFFLILSIAALIEQRSIFHVMVIIGLTRWTGVARLIRAEFLKHTSLEYAQAALALGIPKVRIIARHIMPNAIAPVLVSATFGVASAILVESSLAFLGVGDLSVPSWGETLNAGRTQQKLWLVLAPGAAIFFVVSIFNLVGEGLRDALDPKLRS